MREKGGRNSVSLSRRARDGRADSGVHGWKVWEVQIHVVGIYLLYRKKRVWDEGCVQGVGATLIHHLVKVEQERKQHCALCLHGSGGLIWSREAAHAAPTGGKKLENPVEKEILMENPWRKQRRRRRKTNLSAAEDEERDREVRGWKKRGRSEEGRGTKWESSGETRGRRGRWRERKREGGRRCDNGWERRRQSGGWAKRQRKERRLKMDMTVGWLGMKKTNRCIEIRRSRSQEGGYKRATWSNTVG